MKCVPSTPIERAAPRQGRRNHSVQHPAMCRRKATVLQCAEGRHQCNLDVLKEDISALPSLCSQLLTNTTDAMWTLLPILKQINRLLPPACPQPSYVVYSISGSTQPRGKQDPHCSNMQQTTSLITRVGADILQRPHDCVHPRAHSMQLVSLTCCRIASAWLPTLQPRQATARK